MQGKFISVAVIVAIPAVYVSILVGTSGGFAIQKLEKLFKDDR
jgi:ABC-type glycerol-3-phosphate transport system permease component